MYPFVATPNMHVGRQSPKRLMIVMHSMEVPDQMDGKTAENVANYFTNPSVQASAHFCVDFNSVVQCVKVGDTAWHAPNANNDGIGIEMAGYTRYDRQDWLNDVDMLNRAAAVAAEICYTLKLFPGIDIPRRRLSVPEIQGRTVSGFCGHMDVTNAFNPGGHTDPGDGFPWDVFFQKVEYIMALVRSNPNYRADFQ